MKAKLATAARFIRASDRRGAKEAGALPRQPGYNWLLQVYI
jgi:hypothetical protein